MATEDHDFEEINICTVQKFQWNTESGGAVGKIKPNLKPLLVIQTRTWQQYQCQCIKNLIKKSYETEGDLSHATRIFVHSLFEVYGLLIIDGDDKALKKH